ncbi:helix-turn-helix domain-containing protein [Paractinoplanes globisporus]|uniref:Helix-turn-helix domain-containing protein n=1 Tax=Paractinoplanes globisporus TaxID=113565 RepID=A0ABW6WJ36_9ACTN
MAKKDTAADLLRSLREAQGRSLRAVADEVGIAPSQLSRLERGERSHTSLVGRRLAEYYGISLELLDLLEGRIPPDVVEILINHPEEITYLREKYGDIQSGDSLDEQPPLDRVPSR